MNIVIFMGCGRVMFLLNKMLISKMGKFLIERGSDEMLLSFLIYRRNMESYNKFRYIFL